MPAFPQGKLQAEKPSPLGCQIPDQRYRLPDQRGDGSTPDPHGRTGTDPEDHHRIKNDVRHTSCDHTEHGDPDTADRLKQFFIDQADLSDKKPAEYNKSVLAAIVDYRSAVGKAFQKRNYRDQKPDGQNSRMHKGKEQTQGSSPVRILLISLPEKICRHRICAYAKTDAYRPRKIIQREDKGNCRHGIFADLRYKKAVNNIVQRVDQHGQYHRYRHGHYERQDFFCFHICLIHSMDPPVFCSFSYSRQFLLQACCLLAL